MEPSTLVFLILVVTAASDVQAVRKRGTLAKRVREVEMDIIAWKGTVVNLERKTFDRFKDLDSSLKEELTRTVVPALITPLVKQAFTDIMNEDYIGNMINGHVLEEVQSLKTKLQYTKIEIKALAQRLRSVEQESDTCRKSLGKIRRKFTENIRVLQLQVNQTVADLRDARTSTYPGTTAASTGPTQNNTVPPAPVTTQDSDLQASTTDVSDDLTPSKTVPPSPVTTQDSHATPSPAADRRLYSASKAGDLETVKRILSAGPVEINTRGWNSLTPVMVAAWRGHSDVVEFLVGRGADVSLVDRDGNNVLHSACDGGDLEIVKLIVSMNVVDINSRGWRSRTPVMAAARRGHSDVVEFLVGRGVNVSLVDRDGNNVLHSTCYGGDLETVKLIVSMNVVDINSRGEYSTTPVMVAAYNGHSDVVEFLVCRRANVSLVDGFGNNILHWACDGGDLETMKLIACP
ncbi:ankyrin repeat and KH domain-containing protein mask-like [Haliotis rubra]|uniref:ankyrin repeat and KH domain-containing protein mask-like n=1 Tax=Haliotis rubra TaxID=36100 RepID=UPI001EE58F85|nr:ankyrin repeat and KH domain-containing protein mask-like [Haliotis rubra]